MTPHKGAFLWRSTISWACVAERTDLGAANVDLKVDEHMPYAVNAGTHLYWAEDGSGPPVLMIMGLSFAHEMWFRVLPSLTSQYRVIVFDNRGMGRSDVPRGPYSVPQMARDARAILQAAGIS